MRKAVAIEITGELLQQMLTQGWSASSISCIKGLPEGAEFKGSYVRQWEGIYVRGIPTIVLVFDHPDFPEVGDGQVIPFMDVIFEEK